MIMLTACISYHNELSLFMYKKPISVKINKLHGVIATKFHMSTLQSYSDVLHHKHPPHDHSSKIYVETKVPLSQSDHHPTLKFHDKR